MKVSCLIATVAAIGTSLQFKWSTTNKYVTAVQELKTWVDAETFCETIFQTSLASIHSTGDNTEATNLCQASGSGGCFIGLNDIDTEGSYLWSDGTATDYGNWDTGQPNGGGEDCSVLFTGSGLWHDTSCSSGLYWVICNSPTNDMRVGSENDNYLWLGPTKLTWLNGNQYCMDTFNTTLASVHSPTENTEITGLCNMWGGTHRWIGLNEIQTVNHWEWIDGSVIDYGLNWNPGEPSGGEHGALLVYGTTNWGDGPYNSDLYTSICNAPPSCEIPNKIKHIDQDEIVLNNNDEIPIYDFTMNIDTNNLLLDIDIDLEYLGYSYADNGIYGFGTTYFISFNSFSSNTIDIFTDDGLNECDNRVASSFVGKSFDEKWEYSNTPYLDGHLASNSYLAYPPAGTYWSLSNINKCDGITYSASFSWSDLQNNCNNPQTSSSSVNIEVNDEWMNLTGTIYVNIISPLYKDIDSGIYRIYELINQEFTFAVSKSVHILSSTGISLYKTSIIQQNTETNVFKLGILTEAADYLQLTLPQILIAPNGYQWNIDSSNNGECLNHKSNICIQLWEISTTHNQTCNNFDGVYGFQWIASCNNAVNNTKCQQYVGDAVAMSVESNYEDTTCDYEIGKIQFDGEMSFYRNDSFIGNNNNDYLFAVGEDTIYVEIVINNPSSTYSTFSSSLINVWLCTIDDDVYGDTFSVSQTDPFSTGCLSTIIDADDYNPYWIIQNYDEIFENDAAHIEIGDTNIVRFSFKTPYTLTRDTLWIHTQIEISLINNNNRRLIRKILYDTSSSSGNMRHFISSINVESTIIEIQETSTTMVITKKETESGNQSSNKLSLFARACLLLNAVFVLILN